MKLLSGFVLLAVVSAAQLTPPAYKTLPVGSVTPKGWLLKQLKLQAGQCGHSQLWIPFRSSALPFDFFVFFLEDSYFLVCAAQTREFLSAKIHFHVYSPIPEGLSGHLSMFWNDIMNSVWIGGGGDGGLHERTPYVCIFPNQVNYFRRTLKLTIY